MFDMGEPKIKVIAMPKDTNSAGNIFGGWIMSQIDIAGAVAARGLNLERVVTVSVESMVFKQPVYIGDAVSCYAKVLTHGNTSIKTQIEVVAERRRNGEWICAHVASATVNYVSVDAAGNKVPIIKI